MTFPVICPYCGCQIPTDIEWLREDYAQRCLKCRQMFTVVDGMVVDQEDEEE